MAPSFQIVEHKLPGQHIREHFQATRHKQESILSIAIKQYIPIDLPDPIPEHAITILGFHGNGFPKEAYEPFFADLCANLHQRKVYVRGIWIADTSNQGASGVLNEYIQGDHTSWHDHSRDVLHMVNHFRDQMPRPIVGVAHSFGCAQLVHLSTMHPRLLSTVILMDPIIFDPNDFPKDMPNPASRTLWRRDLWPSHEQAASSLRKAFANWDPRVLEAYLKHGLRQLPTALYNPDTSMRRRSSPNDKPLADTDLSRDAVTLTTTKPHESWTYIHYNGWPAVFDTSDAQHRHWARLLSPMQADHDRGLFSVRPEIHTALQELCNLRPSALFVYGGKSLASPPGSQAKVTGVTGTGQGGSGGEKEGQVKCVVLDGADHLVPLEKAGLGPAASASAEWLEGWFSGWLTDENFVHEHLQRSEGRSSDADGLRLSQEWVDITKLPIGLRRPTGSKPKL